ncbi:hypothetical protein FA95DRAFT_1576240 [Auriscalpium vulgare]|uniref:Uncharacterized protein n=1 Tax=Auriscalpium vulgare TaxID=40419 RepID=A0ACB8RC76_9AGAM|nr:hypothetical protein FA95DRAFT_1576240 [Auriscalpium vulgare]
MAAFPEPYEWKDDQLEALAKRRITLTAYAMNWATTVVAAKGHAGECYVIKVVDRDSEELSILRILSHLPNRHNHTIPAEILECDSTAIIVMPRMNPEGRASNRWRSDPSWSMFNVVEQLIEGVAFMHHNSIAYIDITLSNVVFDDQGDKVYFIDFGSSRWLPDYRAGDIVDNVQAHYHPKDAANARQPFLFDIFGLGHAISELLIMSERKGAQAVCLRMFAGSLSSSLIICLVVRGWVVIWACKRSERVWARNALVQRLRSATRGYRRVEPARRFPVAS